MSLEENIFLFVKLIMFVKIHTYYIVEVELDTPGDLR